MRRLLATILCSGLVLTSCGTAGPINTNALPQKTNVNTNAPATNAPVANLNTNVDLTGWKTVTERSTGIEFKIPKEWKTKTTLVASESDYIPGHTFIGIYGAGDPQDYSMRIDTYNKPLADVRKENPAINGSNGRIAAEETAIINGKAWVKLDYRVKDNEGKEIPTIVYLLDEGAKTYQTGYEVDGSAATSESVIRSLTIGR